MKFLSWLWVPESACLIQIGEEPHQHGIRFYIFNVIKDDTGLVFPSPRSPKNIQIFKSISWSSHSNFLPSINFPSTQPDRRWKHWVFRYCILAYPWSKGAFIASHRTYSVSFSFLDWFELSFQIFRQGRLVWSYSYIKVFPLHSNHTNCNQQTVYPYIRRLSAPPLFLVFVPLY